MPLRVPSVIRRGAPARFARLAILACRPRGPRPGTLLVAPDVQQNLPPISPRQAIRIANRTPEVQKRAPAPPATCTPTTSRSSRAAGTGASATSPAATSSPTSRSTATPARWSRPGRASRPPGSWPAATRATSASSSTPGTSGCRSACCSWRRSSTRGGRSGCCTSTCSCWSAASASPTSSSTRARSAPRSRSSTRCFAYLLGADARTRASARAAPRERLVPLAPAALLVAGIVAARRLPHRPRPGRRQGRRRRLRERRRRHAGPDGKPLYEDSGADDQHFDTYGPVNYLAYVPVREGASRRRSRRSRRRTTTSCPPREPRRSPSTCSRSSACSSSACGCGRGAPGRLLGLALAYGWVALPVHAVPADEQHQRHAGLDAARVGAAGAVTRRLRVERCSALAAAAKFAPLALAPLFASGRGEGSEHGLAGRIRPWTMFSAAFGAVVLVSCSPSSRTRAACASSTTRRSASSSAASPRSASGARTPASTRS